MENIKTELKDIIIDVLIPETENYLKELEEVLKKQDNDDEITEVRNDMESFLEELHAIIYAIDNDEISDLQAQEVFEKVTKMINEHSEH